MSYIEKFLWIKILSQAAKINFYERVKNLKIKYYLIYFFKRNLVGKV